MLDRIAKVLRTEAGILGPPVTVDTSLHGDLATTSLDLICICVGVEEEFGIDISDCDLASWETVGDILRSVEKAMENVT